MNDPDNFLTRWSRRKRGAADEPDRAQDQEHEQGAPDAPPAERAADAAPPPAPAADSGATEPAFDLSQLPPIESITAETDIRAFLAPGVPAEVRLAALRRAWVADPRVRDFVGLNDYDFDFHTPGAIHGFGSLEMTDELRREAVRIVSGWQPEPEAIPPTASAVTAPPSEPTVSSAQPAAAIEEINARASSAKADAGDNSDAGLDHPAQDQDELISPEATTHRNKESVASQQKHSQPENMQTLAWRGHGRALPK
jgi:uncharacterized protein DUF3306